MATTTDEVPGGTVQEVLDWVGDDPGRAQAALDVEREGQNRSTLIAQLEATCPSTEEASVPDNNTATADDVDEETGLAPGPEQPVEVAIHAAGAGTTIMPVSVRDSDVEVADDASLAPEVEQPERDEIEETLIEGEQVEILTGAADTSALALSINGQVFLLNKQMVGALKGIVDKTVVGLSL